MYFINNQSSSSLPQQAVTWNLPLSYGLSIYGSITCYEANDMNIYSKFGWLI